MLSGVRSTTNFLSQLAKQLGAEPVPSSGRTVPAGTHKTTVLCCEEGHLVCESWAGGNAVCVGIYLHSDWTPARAVSICRSVLDPKGVEDYEIVPIGQMYK